MNAYIFLPSLLIRSMSDSYTILTMQNKHYSRNEAQIKTLFYTMGAELSQNGISDLVSVIKYYANREAPELVEKVFKAIVERDILPTVFEYVKPSIFCSLKQVLPSIGDVLKAAAKDIVINSYDQIYNFHYNAMLLTVKGAIDRDRIDALEKLVTENIECLQMNCNGALFKPFMGIDVILAHDYIKLVNSMTKFDTPLAYAVANKKIDIVKYLISEGADVNAKDQYYDDYPLGLAFANNDLLAIKALICNGVDFSRGMRYDHFFPDMIDEAIIGDNYEYAKLLILSGRDFGLTSFHYDHKVLDTLWNKYSDKITSFKKEGWSIAEDSYCTHDILTDKTVLDDISEMPLVQQVESLDTLSLSTEI